MSFWGKILGSMAGFAMGGPFGAMVGAAVGHAADQGAMPGSGRIPPSAADMVHMLGGKENLFSFTIVVLSAKLAKVDGPVKRVEIEAFRQMFRVPEKSLRDVGRLFDQARESAEGWEPFAEKLGEAFADNKAMLEDVLAALVRIARADSPSRYFSQPILISFSSTLNSGSPVMSSAFRSLASAAAKASARLSL